MSVPLIGVPPERLTFAIGESERIAPHYRPIFVDILSAEAYLLRRRSTVLLSDSACSVTAISLDLSPLLRGIVLVGQPALSLRVAFRKCVAAVIVACEALPDAYAAAATVAAGGRVLMQGDQQVNGSVAIIETQPYREREWMDFIKKVNPSASLLLATTKEGGAHAGNA